MLAPGKPAAIKQPIKAVARVANQDKQPVVGKNQKRTAKQIAKEESKLKKNLSFGNGAAAEVNLRDIETSNKKLKSQDKRVKRSKPQMQYLQEVFDKLGGRCPAKKQRIAMAQLCDMSEHQIYKWFWETNNKSLNVATDTLKTIKQDPRMAQLSDWQKFEVFAKKALKQNKKSPPLDGWDGRGETLDKHEILTALKVHWQASKKLEDFEELSLLLG